MIPIDEVVLVEVTLHHPSTGAVTDGDSAPTYDVFEETTDTPILDDQTMTKRTSLTGDYRGQFTASAANGFEAGKWYSVVVTGTVNAITAKHVEHRFRVAPAETSAGVPQVRVSAIADGILAAATFAAGAFDAILTRDWTSVTGEASRSVLNALRQIRNKWSITGTTLTVTKEDDTTTAWTATVTPDASAEPITGSDPS